VYRPHEDERRGVILNMASVAASSGLADRFAYSMSKVRFFHELLRSKELSAYKIRCNCISPARVHTPFVDGFLAKTIPGARKKFSINCREDSP